MPCRSPKSVGPPLRGRASAEPPLDFLPKLVEFTNPRLANVLCPRLKCMFPRYFPMDKLVASCGQTRLRGWTFQLNPAKMIQRIRENRLVPFFAFRPT